MHCYSPGKLLLSAEYLVLDGASALAIPTAFGQTLEIKTIPQPELVWQSYDHTSQQWLQVIFDLPKLRIINATFEAKQDGGHDNLAENLREILLVIKALNPTLFSGSTGFHCSTRLDFPRNWGLGTSSTLINNLAQWANVDPYYLLDKTFKGSGYDIACAQAKGPILFAVADEKPSVKSVPFSPPFADQLYFVHLNKKQNSRDGIQRYRQNQEDKTRVINDVSAISKAMIDCQKLDGFEQLLQEHESVISKLLKKNPIQQSHFSDYFGQTKSLGAWGGDFILATGNEDTPSYFKAKGYSTLLPFKEMCLCP